MILHNISFLLELPLHIPKSGEGEVFNILNVRFSYRSLRYIIYWLTSNIFIVTYAERTNQFVVVHTRCPRFYFTVYISLKDRMTRDNLFITSLRSYFEDISFIQGNLSKSRGNLSRILNGTSCICLLYWICLQTYCTAVYNKGHEKNKTVTFWVSKQSGSIIHF